MVLLWQAYQGITPDGLQYSQCCDAYRPWAGKLALGMRQSPRAGDTLFVAYAGQTMPVVNALPGAVRAAASCIAVLGASHSPFAEATWSQRLPDWIGSHGRACAALGGVPQVVGPDHLQAAVRRAHRDAPTLTRPYAELAQPYSVALVPARAARPREKATGEGGGQGVERWRRARRRHHTFFSLLELPPALADWLVIRTPRPFKPLPGSRQSVCEALDRPALRPLPAPPSEYAAWPLVRVHIDSHVAVDGHSDSVPYAVVKPQLAVRLSAQGVALFHTGTRGASPQRSPLKGRHSTVATHLPTAHQSYPEWPPHRRMLWAAKTGEATAQGVETILASRPHPQQGFRACGGIMRRGNRDGAGRLEAAGRRAIRSGACAETSIASILTHDRDQQPLPGPPAAAPVITHDNIRGAQYAHPNTGDPVGCTLPPSTNAWRAGSRAWPKRSANSGTCRRARRVVAQNAWASWSIAR